MQLVEIIHPETNGRAEVPASAVQGWTRLGWTVAGATEPQADDTTEALPGRNASREVWAAYATGEGRMTEQQIDGLSRDDIAALFHPAEDDN